MKEKNVEKPSGKLGVLIPGLGAVSTTLIAGVLSVRKGLASPIGSLTQMGKIELKKTGGNNKPLIKDFVPLADLNDIVFGGWDVYSDNVYEAATNAGVLKKEQLDSIKDELEAIKPMPAVFDKAYAKNLDGSNVKTNKTKLELVDALIQDIEEFKKRNNCSRLVMMWIASTEKYIGVMDVHKTLANFEKGLEQNNPDIAPSMIYCYAALKLGIPFINGAPNLTCDAPALIEMAEKFHIPIAGKDMKTGQTLMKTIIAPGLAARAIGVNGWFSTNILGNRDGLVLDDPDNFKTKEVSKLSVLDDIFNKEDNPDLYGELYHKVRINYYPPRGDDKESWDNIDIFGWLNYPMQIKVNFLCKDSILAAPVALDSILYMDLAKRVGFYGIQEWLSFYFKSPQVKEGFQPMHDLFKQEIKLQNTLRYLMGEEQMSHLGVDFKENEK